MRGGFQRWEWVKKVAENFSPPSMAPPGATDTGQSTLLVLFYTSRLGRVAALLEPP